MHWTDQIRNVKILLVVSAIVIAVASLVVSHYLVKDLAMEERAKMGVWDSCCGNRQSGQRADFQEYQTGREDL